MRSPSSVAKMAKNGPCNVQIQIQIQSTMANLENFKSMKKLLCAVFVRLPEIVDKLEKTIHYICLRGNTGKQH